MTSTNLVILPVLLPLFTGTILLFIRERVELQKRLSAASLLAGLGLAFYILGAVRADGIQIYRAGDWPPPFGIVFVADIFSAVMVTISMVIGTAVLFFSFRTMEEGHEHHYYYAFFQFLLMGINGSFLTGDIFNLFVFFEVMLMASYILLSLGGKPYQLQESVKFMVMNILASSFFLVAVALLYGVTGTLNMADLAVKVAQAEPKGVLTTISIVFLAVFGLKAALFPLYFWLPRSYYAPPHAVSAIFAALPTKVGVYATIRVFTLIFNYDPGYTHTIILAIAGFTMLFGVLGAISENDFKRILSYHIISQIGYMIMGLGLFTKLSIAGAIFYIVHHIIVKCSLFLVSGVTEQVTGTTDLKEMGGLLKTHAPLGALFFVAGTSLAGIPPWSGFFSKFVLVQAGLLERSYAIVVVSMLVSLLTLFSMMKIFVAVFWGEEKGRRLPQARSYLGFLPPVVSLVVLTVFLGLNAQWILSYALSSAEQLMNPDIYIRAVLGG